MSLGQNHKLLKIPSQDPILLAVSKMQLTQITATQKLKSKSSLKQKKNC